MLTIDGLNSGLDTEAIIQGLLDIQKTHLDRLQLKKQRFLNEQSAFQALEARLLTFRSTAARLGRLQNNVMEARTVDVSDEAALIASASSNAATGIYQLTVEALAQAHQVTSQGFADADSQITQGTFTIQQGSRPSVDITIDGTNDTLQGLADSINLSQSDISASIVQDGSSGGTPYRLLLTSTKSGESNAITVNNGLAASAGGAVQPTIDFFNPVQAAANARVKLGTGPGAINVENADNRMKDLISGVTLDLLQADIGKTIQVRVDHDTETAITAVQDFVDSYNALIDFVAEQSRFVPESEDAGVLLGNRSLIQIQSEIQNALQTVIPGVNVRANRLSTIGISVTDAGKFTFNASTLESALKGDVDGVVAKDLRRLFALDATSTNANIQFVLGSTRTQESTDPLQIDVTQAAERAAIQGTLPVAPSVLINSANNELTLTIDGAQMTVTLAEATYTDSELAAALEAVINAHPDALGRAVAVGLQDDGFGSNSLTITSETYGGSSQVTIQSGSAMTSLGFTGIENDQGVDVEGNFIVNGVVEPATGRGRLLAGLFDNENTADLQVRVTMSAAQVVVGVDGELTVSRGFASRMDQLIGGMLDSETGVFKTINDRYVTDADTVQDAIDRHQEIFEEQEQDLLAQFVALETALGELQSTASFLTQQFANLASLSGRK